MAAPTASSPTTTCRATQVAFEVHHDHERCAALRRDGQWEILGKLFREDGSWYWCPVRHVGARRAMFDLQDAPLDLVLEK